MDVLWAPWRKGFILQKPAKKCFLCKIHSSSRDDEHFVLTRSKYGFAVLNLYPYNNGHLMVVPNRHVDSLEKLKETESLDLLRLTNQAIARLKKSMKPHGINIGINLGRVAGAGLPGHMHIHIVPRWSADTNFMSVTSETKVISESLKSVHTRLKWGKLKK